MFAMKKLILAAFAIVAVVVTSGKADAAFAIRIIHSSGTFTINDNNEVLPSPASTTNYSDQDSSAVGISGAFTNSSSFTIGVFRISSLTGDIGASGATASSAGLGVNISSTTGSGSITFEFSRTGYTFPGGGPSQVTDSFSTNVTTPNGATVSYQSWINSDNGLFSTAGVSVTGSHSNTIPSGGSGPGTFPGTLLTTPATYSITTRTIFTFNNGTTSKVGFDSITDVTNVVPAPAGLLLSLLGLPALAFARRFRRAVPVQA